MRGVMFALLLAMASATTPPSMTLVFNNGRFEASFKGEWPTNQTLNATAIPLPAPTPAPSTSTSTASVMIYIMFSFVAVLGLVMMSVRAKNALNTKVPVQPQVVGDLGHHQLRPMTFV